MAVEADVELSESCGKPPHTQQSAALAAGVVEQPNRSSAGESQAGLTTALLEQKGVVEMLKTLQVTEIPEYYIKPAHLRQAAPPAAAPTQNCIPIVDLESSPEELVAAISSACQWGFFQLINHGTPLELLRKIASESEEFFALPVEEKIRCTTEAKVTGPIHFGGGSRGDWRDVLKLNLAPSSAVAMEYWPLKPVGFRETLRQYATEQQALVKRLLDVINKSLGLENGYINSKLGDQRVTLAINHYPPCPDPSLTMGIREHSDPNTITILLQDEVEGLQVYKDGMWIDVQPVENALVVNVGDHLQILSNGIYSSCLHRVFNNKLRARTSIALFVSPSLMAPIKPAPTLIDEKHPAVYREFLYGQFLKDFYSGGGPNKKVTLSQFEVQDKLTT